MKKRKSKLSKFNSFLVVVLVICIAATAFVIYKYPKIEVVDATESSTDTDEAVIDEFTAVTCGGKEFKTQEDVVNYYIECYNNTKKETASYTDGGNKVTYYALLGDEELSVENLLVEGKSSSIVDELVPGILSSLFKGNTIGLPPSGGKNAETDIRNDTFDCSTSLITADDILAANAKDNGDGTITLTLQPKAVILSMPGEDSQGKFFNSLGDISSTVESISVLSFSSGTIDENFVVNYKGGTGVVKIDTSTNTIVEADYTMKVHIDVSHANVLVLKDKSASLDIVYANHFPADATYMKEHSDIVKL